VWYENQWSQGRNGQENDQVHGQSLGELKPPKVRSIPGIRARGRTASGGGTTGTGKPIAKCQAQGQRGSAGRGGLRRRGGKTRRMAVLRGFQHESDGVWYGEWVAQVDPL